MIHTLPCIMMTKFRCPCPRPGFQGRQQCSSHMTLIFSSLWNVLENLRAWKKHVPLVNFIPSWLITVPMKAGFLILGFSFQGLRNGSHQPVDRKRYSAWNMTPAQGLTLAGQRPAVQQPSNNETETDPSVSQAPYRTQTDWPKYRSQKKVRPEKRSLNWPVGKWQNTCREGNSKQKASTSTRKTRLDDKQENTTLIPRQKKKKCTPEQNKSKQDHC